MNRWLWWMVIFTLGVAGPTAAGPAPASDPGPGNDAHQPLRSQQPSPQRSSPQRSSPQRSPPERTIDEADAPQLAKRRRRKRRKGKRKKQSKRERKKEAEEAKRKAAEEAAAQKAAEEEAAAKAAAAQAAEQAAQKEAEEAARLAALPVLAVLPLGGTDVALSDLGTLNQALRDALAATQEFRLQDQATTNELVAASQSLGVDCASASEACAEQLGALAGASYAVVGQVVFLPPADARDDAGANKGAPTSILGGKLGVHLAMMPVGGDDALLPPRRVRGLIPSDPAGLADNLNPLLSVLLDRKRDLSDLVLTVKPAGALVAVDGLPLGAAPVSSPGGLLPGQHVVSATLEGHLPKALSVQVGTARQEVTILLEEDPDLVKERSIAWWEIAAPWSVFGVGAVASLGGAAAMAFTGLLVAAAGQTFGGIETLDRNAPTYPQDASAGYQQNAFVRELYDTVGLYALVGGGVFLAAGGLLAVAGAGWGSYYFVVDRTEE